MRSFGLEWFAAGCGCAIADGTFHPLETFKVRQQATSRPLAVVARAAYRDAGRSVFAGWWRPALAPTIARAFTCRPGVAARWPPGGAGGGRHRYTGFRIGSYPTARDAFSRALGRGDASLGVRLGAGMATGFVGAAVFNPLRVAATFLWTAHRARPTP